MKEEKRHKMSGEVVSISSYSFKPEDRLFLDTNIWMFVYGPNSQDEKKQEVKVYSRALDNMLKAKSKIYIDVLVVSEFINSYARIQFNIQSRLKEEKKQYFKNFKKFRQSEEFKPIAKAIADDTKRLLKHCTRIESGFETLNIEAIVDEYSDGKSDFNDQVIAAICKKEELKLVTDDGDFADAGIFILTLTGKRGILS